MKKFLTMFLAAMFLSGALVVGKAHALSFPFQHQTIYVPSHGDTGWQTFSHTFTAPWSGTVGIGVSDYLDFVLDSVLLIDNLITMGPAGNPGFETGDFSGYTVFGGGASIGALATSAGGMIYNPTQGLNMAILTAFDADTSAFGGTDGAYITFPLSVDIIGTTVSFDWAFLAMDYYPFHDFAFLAAWDDAGLLLGHENLAQIVPEPGTIFLLAVGLLGLAVFARMRRCNQA